MQETVQTSFDLVEESLRGFIGTASEFMPKLIGALIILIIGWVIAKIIKWGIVKLLKAVQFDKFTDRLGINGYLMKGGIKKTGSDLIATLVYWIIMLTVLTAFFNNLGLEVVSNLLKDVIQYIPNILVACLLLVVGMYLAEFVSGLVVAALKTGGVDNPAFFGKLANFGVMFFVVAIVLTQLGIGSAIIENVVSIVLGGLGLAVAIAFGLGGREWAGNLINKHLKF